MPATTTRNTIQQSEHDAVVRALAKWVEDHYDDVRANPGSAHSCAIDGLYPDVVAFDETENESELRLRRVYEVETEDTVVAGEAERQWRRYAQLGAPFRLVVPFGNGEKARRLLRRYSLRGNVVVYEVLQGKVLFGLGLP